MERPISTEDARESLLKQPQPPQWVHCVHCAFEGKINVQAFEEHDCLLHDTGPFVVSQLLDPGKKVMQGKAGTQFGRGNL
jgi:hypothetical protein